MNELPDVLSPWDKSLWPAVVSDSVSDYVAAGHHLFDGSVSWPVATLTEAALAHNIATLARFSAEHQLLFAPHGKTSMSPSLFARQLAAGAWGLSVATVSQARIARAAGADRVLIAHQVLDPAALDWIASQPATRDRYITFFVDSAEGVAAAARAASSASCTVPLIVDVGYSGGRTGVRSAAEARELAELIARTDGVQLVGVNGYEGGLPDTAAVHAFFAQLRSIVEDLRSAELLAESPIVTAGGSAYFDCVASDLGGSWAQSIGAQVVLRSGAYISHDDGTYRRKTAYNRIADEGQLQPAFHVWAQIVSTPETGLALAGMGKRDAPYDSDLPVPLALRRAGSDQVVDIRSQATVSGMDDQHCYVRPDSHLPLRPGDLMQFGISHPCTAFDKWRAIPIVDADYRIIDVVRTYF